MIDLHCHLLPGVDDGPPTMQDALAMARAHVAAGVGCVAATPHVTWEIPTRGALVRDKVAELRSALAAEDIPLQVTTGGEIAMTVAVELSDAELRALALGGGPWLLIEAPLSPSAMGFERIVQHIQLRGHQVVLAHPERCPAFQRRPELLEALVRGGALAQLTAGSFVGRFGTTVQRCALELVARGLVHHVASDAHDDALRPPGMHAELERAGLGALTDWWCSRVPAAILAGERVPPQPLRPPDLRPRRGLLRRWRG